MPAILETLRTHYGPKGVLARNDSPVRALEGLPQEVSALYGEVPERVPYREGSVTLFAAPYTGQKTGAFLDQRENHVYAGSLARGEMFGRFFVPRRFRLAACERASHRGAGGGLERRGFSASRGGRGAQRAGAAYAQGGTLSRCCGLSQKRGSASIPSSWTRPPLPKGAVTWRAPSPGYKEINLRAMTLLGPGGRLFTASCSHHVSEPDFYAMLTEAAADAGVRMRVLERRGAASCHPERLGVPETRYLTFAALELEE